MPSNINFNLSIDLTDNESPVILAGLGAALTALGGQLSNLFASQCQNSDSNSDSDSDLYPDTSDPSEMSESTGEVVCSEVCQDDEEEQEEEQEAEPEEERKPVVIEAPRDESPEEKARFRRDRIDLLRKAAGKVFARDGKPGPIVIIPPLPRKSMGQRPMEAFLERYTANPGVSCVKSKDGYVVGVDYTMDGRPVTLSRIFTNGACLVSVKGTRYYRAVPLETLGRMFPAKASPKYEISDPKPGMEVYVGMGLESDEYARSFRKAVVRAVHKDGLIEVEYPDNGSSSHCGIAQLSSKPLVR